MIDEHIRTGHDVWYDDGCAEHDPKEKRGREEGVEQDRGAAGADDSPADETPMPERR